MRLPQRICLAFALLASSSAIADTPSDALVFLHGLRDGAQNEERSDTFAFSWTKTADKPLTMSGRLKLKQPAETPKFNEVDARVTATEPERCQVEIEARFYDLEGKFLEIEDKQRFDFTKLGAFDDMDISRSDGRKQAHVLFKHAKDFCVVKGEQGPGSLRTPCLDDDGGFASHATEVSDDEINNAYKSLLLRCVDLTTGK